MPKEKSPKKSNLRVLREELGLSQAKFAADVGIRKSSVDHIEAGRSRMTPELATKISARFMVDREGLLNDRAPLRDVWGKPYDAVSAMDWDNPEPAPEKMPSERIDRCLATFGEFYRALVEASTPTQQRELILSLDEVLAKHLEKVGEAAFCNATRKRGKLVEMTLNAKAISELWPEVKVAGADLKATVLSYLRPERSPLQRVTLSAPGDEESPATLQRLHDIQLRGKDGWVAKHEIDDVTLADLGA